MENRVVVISGASGGVGSILVDAFLENGDFVAAIGRRTGVKSKLPRLLGLQANLRDIHDAQCVADEILGLFGTVDVIVNGVGITENAMFDKMSLPAFERILMTNVACAFTLTQALLPAMRAKKCGNIVNIGSVVGEIGAIGCCNYATSKAALRGLTKSLSNELLTDGVMVNNLTLGYCNVGMGAKLPEKIREKIVQTIPLKRFADNKDIIDAVMFLAKTRYMTGNELKLAGGL